MCRPFRPENRGNITIPRPYDLGYYVAPFQGLKDHVTMNKTNHNYCLSTLNAPSPSCPLLPGKERIVFHDFVDAGAYVGNDGLVGGRIEHRFDEFGNEHHQVFFGTACGDGRCAETDA